MNYDRLREQYGSVTADTTFQFLNSWQSNYQRAAFIDTGVKKSPRYESHAKKLATENGWKYEKIHGNLQLIEALLTENVSNDQILVVPPEHTIGFDPMKSTLSANPLYSERDIVNELPWKDIVDGDEQETGDSYTIGLGIDAGGTYTDIVVYDLLHSKTLGKTKALTTKWDFTKGISQALSGLDAEQLKHVQLVALSTTLATNAIVKGNGQKVGLILMPPP